jgi:hypothetical protein
MAARNPFASSDIYDPYAMIQSSRPARLSTGYYVVRNLLLVGAIAGGLVALYRNDVFRELARRAGQESRYLAAEQSFVGTPGWGTPRSMEPVLAGAPAATTEAAAAPVATESPTVAEMPAAVAPAPPAPEPPAATPAVAAPAREPASPVVAAAPVQAPAPPPAAAPPAPPPKPIDPLAPVSLDSLPVLTKAGTVSQPVSFDALPASRGAAPASVARTTAPAPAARPAAAPTDRSKAKAIRVSLDETPRSGRSIPPPTRAAAPPPAPPPEPPPVAHKPEPPKLKTTDAHKNDNPLMAAVRSAVKARPPKESVPAAQ